MTRTLEFYFDDGSPYSYLADTQVEAIACWVVSPRRWGRRL